MKYALALMVVVLCVGLNWVVAQPVTGSEKWEQAYALARMLEQDPNYDLDTVHRYLKSLFRDPKTNIDYFKFTPLPISSLRNLVRALSRHARQAYERGDWERGEQAFELAFQVIGSVLLLKPPAKVPIQVPIGKYAGQTFFVSRGSALIEVTSLVSAGVFLVDEQLQLIAEKDERYKASFQRIKQRAREIGKILRSSAKQALSAMDKGDEARLTRIMDRSVVELRPAVDKWVSEARQFLRQLRPQR